MVSQATFHDIKNRAESARKLRDRRRKSYLAMVAMCPVPKRDQLQRLEQAVGEAAKRANDAQEALDKCGWYFNKKIETNGGLRTRKERDEELLQWVHKRVAERVSIADALASAEGDETRLLSAHLRVLDEVMVKKGVDKLKEEVMNRLAAMLEVQHVAMEMADGLREAEDQLRVGKESMDESQKLASEAGKLFKVSEDEVEHLTNEFEVNKTQLIEARRKVALCRRDAKRRACGA